MGKKILIGVGILLLLALMVGGIIYIRQTKQYEQEELDKHLVLLNVSGLKDKIENKDTFMLIITQTTCEHCEAYLPVFKKVLADYDLTGYQIHQDLLQGEDLAYLKSVASINGTPTIIFLKEGEETSTLNRLVGDRSRSETIDRLRVMGYIE